MKVLYFGFNSFKLHKRGVENVIDFQSKACVFEQLYYLHWGSKTTSYKNNKFICISIKHCWYWPLILNMVLFKIKRNNKLLIHSHNPLFSFLSVFKTDIFTVHDGLYYLNKSKNNKSNYLFYIVEKLLYFRCKIVHFISTYTKEQTLYGHCKNFVTIPNTSHFEKQIKNIKSQVNYNDKINILIVRSIEERARIDLLLEVAEKINNKKYKFIVAGKGPLLEYYKSVIQSKNLKNIEMLGYVNDKELLQLYTDCDIVLMLAEYGEGFGLPIIEGYLFNKPVIASNKCAIPEVIISKEFLFENNVEDILNKINEVEKIKNINFRSYYFNKFSNSIVLSQIRELYLNNI